MTSTPTDKTPTSRPTPAATVPQTGGALQSSHGATRIAEQVVSKIAGLSTREVRGVYDLGGGAARAFGTLRERIPGAATSAAQGVSVEVGEKQAAVDIELVAEYGVAIAELATSVRRNVIGAIERMTGLEVVEVNVHVGDVHVPAGDDGDEPRAPRDTSRVA